MTMVKVRVVKRGQQREPGVAQTTEARQLDMAIAGRRWFSRHAPITLVPMAAFTESPIIPMSRSERVAARSMLARLSTPPE